MIAPWMGGMRMNKGDRSEPWARKQRDAGLPVSFPADWSDEDRSVSGEFVLELLLDLESVDIVLANAIVVTPVEHRYARITGELRFDNCRFEKQVSLPLANFERRARFRGCVFNGDLDLPPAPYRIYGLTPGKMGSSLPLPARCSSWKRASAAS